MTLDSQVRVGVSAGSPRMAERKVARLYQKGLALSADDGSQVVSVQAELDRDQEVVFKTVETLPLDAELPEPVGIERPVSLDERTEAAFEACQRLIAAVAVPYARGPDLHDFQMAFEFALRAIPREQRRPVNKRPRGRRKEMMAWLQLQAENAKRELEADEGGKS